MTDSFQVQLSKIIKDYTNEEIAKIDKCLVKAGNYARDDLRQNSPKHTGDYARGWKTRKRQGRHIINVTIYNATDWQLTHLLENPHLIRNQYGEWGMTSPGNGQHVHIKPAQERAEKYLLDLLEKEL